MRLPLVSMHIKCAILNGSDDTHSHWLLCAAASWNPKLHSARAAAL